MDKTDKFDYKIRKLTTKDIEQYNSLLRYAFQVTEQELMESGWHEDEIKQSKFPVLERADVQGCYDGEDLISQIAVYPIKMNVYNETYDAGFITSVATYPEYSGQGIMAKLIKNSLKRMRDKKQSIALLYPYSIPLYRKYGWEIVSNKISYVIKDRQIPSKDKILGYVRRVDWNDEEFINLHSKFAQRTHGCLFRNALAWEEYWRWTADDTTVAIYYNSEDIAYGYMVYLIRDDIMYIKEMIYLNREAQNGLWEYIHAHDSMIDEVRGNNYFNEPLAFDMDDGDIKEMIRPYIMGRIVDVEQFILKYKCNKSEERCIAFNITDSILEWNNKIFNILFYKGRCSITNKTPDYSVSMSIATFTTLLLGYKTAMQLYKIERIEGNLDAINCLDDVIMHECPYISDYI